MKSGNITLSKAMVHVLAAVINGSDRLEALQKEMKLSKSWMARIVDSLDKQGFIRKVRKGKVIIIELATTPHAIAFKDMYLDKPYRKYAKIFSGKNLDVLQAIVSGEKSTATIGEMLQVQARIIRPRIRFLANNGLITKIGKRYTVAKQQKKAISFLQSLRNFSEKKGIVLWQFGNAALLKANKPSDVSGLLTGFNRYADFGVEVNTSAFVYFTGIKKLSIEDIFVHSLFEVNDTRSFALATTLYVKQGLYKKHKIMQLAEKFDKLNEADSIAEAYEMIKNKERSPLVEEILRLFDLYEVKNV
jgi:predicted transcriptional regulator